MTSYLAFNSGSGPVESPRPLKPPRHRAVNPSTTSIRPLIVWTALRFVSRAATAAADLRRPPSSPFASPVVAAKEEASG